MPYVGTDSNGMKIHWSEAHSLFRLHERDCPQPMMFVPISVPDRLSGVSAEALLIMARHALERMDKENPSETTTHALYHVYRALREARRDSPSKLAALVKGR